MGSRRNNRPTSLFTDHPLNELLIISTPSQNEMSLRVVIEGETDLDLVSIDLVSSKVVPCRKD